MLVVALGTPAKAVAAEAAQPEMSSPCTFDLDAGWLVPLKTVSVAKVMTKIPHPVNCEGAVVKAVTATGKDATTTLEFTVAYKPGHDRTSIVSFAVLDDDKRTVAVGEARDNLKAGANSSLSGTFKIKSREFDRAFASGTKPMIRVTVRMEND